MPHKLLPDLQLTLCLGMTAVSDISLDLLTLYDMQSVLGYSLMKLLCLCGLRSSDHSP